MNIEKTVTRNLLDIQAVSLQPDNPFTWADGIKSPIYCNNRLVLSSPERYTMVMQGLVELIKQEYAEAEVTADAATVDIPWGAMMADKLEKPFDYVRSSNKSYDRGNKIGGEIEQGAKVVVVEDLISTGGSVKDVAKSLRGAGAEVLGVVVIFTYLLPASTELLHSTSRKFKTLSNYDVLIDVALEHAYIKSGGPKKLKTWRQDPKDESWMERQNREHSALRHRVQQVFYALLVGAATVGTYRGSYMKKRLLVPEDGSVYEDCDFGANHYQMGEFMFDTGVSGYQEVLSGLSYCNQVAMMAYPMIRNYGINRDDFGSLDPAVFGFTVKKYCAQLSNFRCGLTLDKFLKLKEIPRICYVNTRAITRKLRSSGTMRAIMANADADMDAMVKLLKKTDSLYDRVARVLTQKPLPIPARGEKVILMDFRAEHGIICELSCRSCDLVVILYNTSAQIILTLHPDGIMLGNSPGDPKDMTGAIKEIRELVKHVPVFGICLGRQLISLACGVNMVKLKFGHRGYNHPVLNLPSKKVEITSQSHGYAVEAEGLANTDLTMIHQALNDKSVEGVRHKHCPVFSVQYHPEAAPGPENVNYLFGQFMKLTEEENV